MSFTKRLDSPRKPAAEYFDRQPPVDLQAEVGVLGSAVLLPDVLDDVMLILRPDDFYDDAHRKLFIHMCGLHESNKKIDPTLLIDRLKSAGEFEAVGGSAYLSKIINAVPNAAHAIYYAEIVRDKATLRSLIIASTEILHDSYEATEEPVHLVGQAEQKIFQIHDSRNDSTVKPLKEVLFSAMDRLESRSEGEQSTDTVETGFTLLDAQTGGLHQSELIILAARPSMGKTALALNIAEYVGVALQIPTLFVSLEMAALELADRMLCSRARIDSHRVRRGTLSKEDRERLVEKSSELSTGTLFIDDAPSRTVSQIAAAARRLKRRHGNLGLIIIDYLQLLEPDNHRDPRQEQVAKMARRLKMVARELKVPVLCLAQLNRQSEVGGSNIPRLSHLRESGAIEQDADVVMFVHREEYYHQKKHGENQPDPELDRIKGKAQIIVAKQRNGPTGTVELAWFRQFTRFENLAPDHYAEFEKFNQGEFD
jgi:replicative DNA helicase